MNSMSPSEKTKEWDTIQRAERDRKTAEQQLHFATTNAAKLDRVPQVKLGPSASAMEHKAMQKAREHGTSYEAATERGEGVQEAQQQLLFVEGSRELFDAARTAYSEARELGFSRTRSAYEAAREALLFGTERETEKPTIERHLTQDEPTPLRGIARLKALRTEREEFQVQKQEQDSSRPRKREPEREASIWDALDGIGREQSAPTNRTTPNDAMRRVQECTAERQEERERKAALIEQESLAREKLRYEKDHEAEINYGL